ncbi:SDR family oxidoreductase [Nocardia seriolae]|uniref:SDR family oxidoreductase n=1 Tax=Nocardia seriolae TaxID=37332 RepID=UPI00051A740C|nr:aldehyde reductase [Nocardia seriolae]MTJ60778.1 NAD-dependent epimerase/dehydratase family protein [Nocardia seriolae]MTJ70285.1 NAD-dependent epimerase/dehydratase family protein [Nocardia seriolae]MTJ91079.1 NAD-dependent epimerase/dehydratase family protein [Nocardia seriolae]MTK35041.1 NAD-dependent epimerase/dehydratase family protein [Nocardia seriolae]MTK38765.1 NAD-dependent epimerase/dehydratase family protein [Nocardia seriolae]
MSDLVLVTGASGYVAGHGIQELLGRGYRVRGTVRSVQRAAAVAGILPGVELVEADLGSDTGWAEAVAGCRYVVHTASPFPSAEPQHEDELVRPAVDGTRRVLRAAAASGVERVVLTSSVAAIHAGHQGRVLTEADWSDLAACDAYQKSKTLAERAAWDFVAEHPEIELAVINPAMIIGPILRPEIGTSVDGIRALLAGGMPGVPRLNFATVDVRDLAVAHRLAMESPKAAGNRYICAGDQISFPDMAHILARRYRVSTRVLPDWLVRLSAPFNADARTALRYLGREEHLSAARIESELGWRQRPVADSLLDTAASLIEFGLVTDPGTAKRAAA